MFRYFFSQKDTTSFSTKPFCQNSPPPHSLISITSTTRCPRYPPWSQHCFVQIIITPFWHDIIVNKHPLCVLKYFKVFWNATREVRWNLFLHPWVQHISGYLYLMLLFHSVTCCPLARNLIVDLNKNGVMWTIRGSQVLSEAPLTFHIHLRKDMNHFSSSKCLSPHQIVPFPVLTERVLTPNMSFCV